MAVRNGPTQQWLTDSMLTAISSAEYCASAIMYVFPTSLAEMGEICCWQAIQKRSRMQRLLDGAKGYDPKILRTESDVSEAERNRMKMALKYLMIVLLAFFRRREASKGNG